MDLGQDWQVELLPLFNMGMLAVGNYQKVLIAFPGSDLQPDLGTYKMDIHGFLISLYTSRHINNLLKHEMTPDIVN